MWLPSISDIRQREDHKCKLPRAVFRKCGARWMCDDCEAIWQLIDDYEAKYWRLEKYVGNHWQLYGKKKRGELPTFGSQVHPSVYCGCPPCLEERIAAFDAELKRQIGLLDETKKQLQK